MYLPTQGISRTMNALTGTGTVAWKLSVIKAENTSELQQPMVLGFYDSIGSSVGGTAPR